MKAIGWIFVLAAFECSCNQSQKADNLGFENQATAPDTTNYEEVSMISLIANPDRYNGKRVIVSGFLHIEFESNMIYLNETDFKNNLTKNAIWIGITREQMESPMMLRCQNKYGFVKGIFDMNDKGHYEMNSGAMTKIIKAAPLR